MEFNFDNLVLNLPDAYKKTPESNNHKLLLVEKHIYNGIRSMLQTIFDSLDIDNASGAALDMWGQRQNVPRGSSDDTQYRIRIKANIAQSLCDGSRNSVADALAYMLSTDTSKIKIKDGEQTGLVHLIDIPLTLLVDGGFTTDQIIAMIEAMLAEGVHLSYYEFSGTFEFSGTDDDYDESKGFADVEGSIGGYFGLLNA